MRGAGGGVGARPKGRLVVSYGLVSAFLCPSVHALLRQGWPIYCQRRASKLKEYVSMHYMRCICMSCFVYRLKISSEMYNLYSN